MRVLLKTAHLLALSAFVGTVFLHVLVSATATPSDAEAYAALMALKDTTTRVLILPGVVVLGMSGMTLARRLPRPWPLWLRAKLALVPLLAVNGLFILLPVGAEIASAAQAGPVPDALLVREEIAGMVNVVLILAVLVLSVRRTQA
jgi:hypothetical protein